MAAFERDLLSNREIVLFWLVPINEMDSFGDLARFALDRDAVGMGAHRYSAACDLFWCLALHAQRHQIRADLSRSSVT